MLKDNARRKKTEKRKRNTRIHLLMHATRVAQKLAALTRFGLAAYCTLTNAFSQAFSGLFNEYLTPIECLF